MYSTLTVSSALVGPRWVNDLSASWTRRSDQKNARLKTSDTGEVDLPTAIIKIPNRCRTAPIHAYSKTYTTTVVQTINGLGIVVPVLVLVLIPGPGWNIGWEGRRRPRRWDWVTT